MSKFSAESIVFSKSRTLWQVLVSFSKIVHPAKGFSWQNMKKSVTRVLKLNSRYLQSKTSTIKTHLRHVFQILSVLYHLDLRNIDINTAAEAALHR